MTGILRARVIALKLETEARPAAPEARREGAGPTKRSLNGANSLAVARLRAENPHDGTAPSCTSVSRLRPVDRPARWRDRLRDLSTLCRRPRQVQEGSRRAGWDSIRLPRSNNLRPGRWAPSAPVNPRRRALSPSDQNRRWPAAQRPCRPAPQLLAPRAQRRWCSRRTRGLSFARMSRAAREARSLGRCGRNPRW